MAKYPIYNPQAFDQENVACPKCGWTGKGRDTLIIDLYGITKNREVHCPECDNYLGALPLENNPKGDSGSQLGFQIG